MSDLNGETTGANVGAFKRLFSLSTLSGERGLKSTDSDSRHGSTMAFENSSKCHKSSSVGVVSTRMKSGISTETCLAPGSGSLEMDVKKEKQREELVVGGGEGLSTNTLVQDSQHGIETLCSNSSPFVAPVSLPSMDSSNSKAFDRSPDEPLTASCESGLSAQIANARNGMKFLSRATEGKMGSYKDEVWVNESADSSTTKEGKKSAKGEDDKAIAGFDLNEDLNANTLDYCVHSVSPCASSHSVIHVVAKPGIPSSRRPMMPLKFEGDLGWKGTAQTSAFRSTNHKPKEPQSFMGIDLNFAVEDDINRKHATSPWIDLNCLYDAADESPILESSPLVDLNLVAKRSSDGHWLGQASRFPNPDFSLNTNVYLADLSTIQRMANNGHTLMASPQFLQRMERHIPPSITNQSRYFHVPEGVDPGSLYTASLKRKEPEGGLDCFQLGYKQLI